MEESNVAMVEVLDHPDVERLGDADARDAGEAFALLTTDRAVIEYCRDSWPEFGRLYDGGVSEYGDEAARGTQALVTYLVRAGVDDLERIDRLVRGSGLMHDRWNDADFRHRTVHTSVRVELPRDGHSSSEREQLERGRERLRDELEMVAARERHGGDMLVYLGRLSRNRGLGEARVVALVLAVVFAHCESRYKMPPYTLPIAEIADAAGIDPTAAAQHVEALDRAGLLWREVWDVPTERDYRTGVVVPAHRSEFLAPKESALQFAREAAQLELGYV